MECECTSCIKRNARDLTQDRIHRLSSYNPRSHGCQCLHPPDTLDQAGRLLLQQVYTGFHNHLGFPAVCIDALSLYKT